MPKANQPVAAFIFNAAGVLAWIVAGVAFYREEAMPMLIPAGGLPIDVESIQLLHSQMGQLVLCCSFAIIGTLFFGFSAILKQLAGAPGTLPDD